MTPRQIVVANIECAHAERIGFNFTGVEGRLNDFAGAGIQTGFQEERWQDDDYEYYTDVWGNTWHRLRALSVGGEVYRPALREWDDLDRYELPDLDNAAYYDQARALGRSGTDRFTVGWLPGWPFAICRYLRKMEVYFVDLVAERSRIDVLHDRVTTLLERVIDRYGEAGMDGVMFCEDLGTQDRLLMPPAMCNDIFRPLYERLTGRAHAHGMKVIQHSCGYNWELVDGLCEAGIDCLQFDQPAIYDMPALAARLRAHRVGLFAPCDIQQVLPTGRREYIEAQTEALVRTFHAGLIAKNYGDLHGIGVDPEWDKWAYDTFVRVGTAGGGPSLARA